MVSLGVQPIAEIGRDLEPVTIGDVVPTVSVVIPARNEAKNIGWVLEGLPKRVTEVVLVDGRSRDGTIEVARRVRPDIVVVSDPVLGKGAAVRAGLEAATGDIVVMLDADGSMDPKEIERFVSAIEGGSDVVKGSRFLEGGGSTDLTLLRSVGNRFLLLVVNLLYRSQFTELCYGYFAFRRDAVPRLDLQAIGFEIETEIVVRAVRANLRVSEVPSMEAKRHFGQSNLKPVRDGCRVLRTLLNVRFADRSSEIIDLTANEQPQTVDLNLMGA